MRNIKQQAGYTLIELLLYVTVVGSLLTAVSLYFATSAESRIKNQSIVEVNQQGALAMERITQTIRNADSITSPAAGSSASSLTLVVPTGSLSPTIFDIGGATSVLGYDQDGVSTDASNSGFINACSFTASTSGTVTTLYARVASVTTAPNNKAQMAIYSGVSNPTTLLASSGDTTLTANSWNAFTIPSVSISAGTKYWLAYNTNGTAPAHNDMRYHPGAVAQSMYTSMLYGTWPGSFTGLTQNYEYSMYADVVAAGSTALQVKEGAASAAPLVNSKVQISSLTFTNLTRSGTPGVIRISFTISRVNPSNRNAYDFQKTFTASAALRDP